MTESQRELARALVLGESIRDVARSLGVRPQSVRRYLSALYRQLGLRSQAELVGWCVAHGVVTVPELQEVYCKRGNVGQGSKREPEGAPLTGQIRR